MAENSTRSRNETFDETLAIALKRKREEFKNSEKKAKREAEDGDKRRSPSDREKKKKSKKSKEDKDKKKLKKETKVEYTEQDYAEIGFEDISNSTRDISKGQYSSTLSQTSTEVVVYDTARYGKPIDNKHTKMKIAIYGDSYVARLAIFCNHNLEVPADVRFYGKGGMTALHFDRDILQQLLQFKPDYTIINVGGNDIQSDSVPKLIVENVMKLVTELESNDIKVIFCNICERGTFPKDNCLTKKSFNSQRKKINELMKKKVDTMHLNMRFPLDYDQDGVHFSCPKGQTKYFYFLQRFILALKKIK